VQSKTTSTEKTTNKDAVAEEKNFAAFVRAYFDYKIGKQIARHILTPGLEPRFFDSRFDKSNSIKNRTINDIKKLNPSLLEELKFFAQVVTDQEMSRDTEFDSDLLINLYGCLGGLYLNYDSASYKLPQPTNFAGRDFEFYCWKKLAVAIFFEQERVFWHGVALLTETKENKKLYKSEQVHWGTEELRDCHQNEFEEFIKFLGDYLAMQPNLFDSIDTAICSRRFYWNFIQNFIENAKTKTTGLYDRVERRFPSVIIHYCDGEDARVISTDPTDPIFRLNRTTYRPNSKNLVADCNAVLNDTASATLKQRVSDWVRPFKKFIFSELGLSFMAKTREHHRITEEFSAYLLKYVVVHRNHDRPPNLDAIHKVMLEFIKFKKAQPDMAPILDSDGLIKPMPVERYHQYINSKALFQLENHFQEITSEASSVLGKKSTVAKDMTIVSLEHPDSKRGNVAVVLPMIQNIIAQGIEVEVCIGAFRYSEGAHAGKVIDEISLACYFETPKQKQYLEDIAGFYHQESYLVIDKELWVSLVDLKNGNRTQIGTWLEVQRINHNDLGIGEGYTLINGKYFQAKSFDADKPLVESNDFRNVRTRFGQFVLTDRQAKVIKYIYSKYEEGIAELKGSDIIEAVNSNDQIQRIFDTRVDNKWVPGPAWDKLIVNSKHGYYKLKL